MVVYFIPSSTEILFSNEDLSMSRTDEDIRYRKNAWSMTWYVLDIAKPLGARVDLVIHLLSKRYYWKDRSHFRLRVDVFLSEFLRTV